jgi:hypothetical protein
MKNGDATSTRRKVMTMIKVCFLLTGLCVALVLAACGAGTQQIQSAPQVQSGQQSVPTPGLASPDQNGSYQRGLGVYQPLEVYTITGTVQAAPGSVTQYSMEGRFSGSGSNGYSYSSGYVSAGTDGKGIVRLHIDAIDWVNAYVSAGALQRDENWTPLAVAGDTVIVKVEDTRGTQFVAGDRVVLLCREQWEFVGAVAVNEIPTLENVSREFDLCRMADGKVQPAPTPMVVP